jgi:hypothetical protein
MIKIYNDPILLDYIKICCLMPEDERKQIEEFVGQPYDIDSVAVGNFMVPGPKWVIKDENVPLVVGGFKQQRPGVWRDYMLTTPQAWDRQYWFTVTRTCRRAMDGMFSSGQAHRLECVAPAARLSKRPELEKWYKFLGYHNEGIRYGYCADGSDAVAFSRVQH